MRGIEKANPETLYAIFGDAQWTNKERLSDSLLRDLIEHFSRINLGNQAAQADVLGQSYEYLIKKFAAYRNFADQPGLARVASLEDIRAKDGNLSIPLYVAPAPVAEQARANYVVGQEGGLDGALTNWLESSRQVRTALDGLLKERHMGLPRHQLVCFGKNGRDNSELLSPTAFLAKRACFVSY